jgi:predicted outer membrane repeat protein
VSYSDPDNDIPSIKYVYIDGAPYTMTLAPDGTYSYSTTSLAPGTHTYYFFFEDGYGGSARFPDSGTLPGPLVNHPPMLGNEAIDRTEGTTETTFTYSVHYSDADGDIPAAASVYIDGSTHTMVLSSGTASNGTYTYSTTLPSGSHSYYFSFTDAFGEIARLPVSDSYPGPSVYSAHIVYVDGQNGQVGNTGRSWALAVPSIQEAITLADPGDQVWVKQGVFYLTQPIEVTKDLELYGGFNGSEHNLKERDFTNNTVYVDGQGLVRCFSLSGAASTVIIDGFCIRNGYSPSNPGGGISNMNMATSLTIANCTFRDNYASQGGGINNSNNASQLMVISCLFENNTASTCYTGGGIYSMSASTCYTGGGIYSMSAYTEISQSVFTGNTAGNGGGISCTGPKICISNSLFNKNSAYNGSYDTRGGGIRIWNSADATITNCTIYGNQASYKGGGIYCESSTVSVWNSIVWSNSWGAYNKQIFGLSSTVTVDYCDVELGAGETPWGGHCIDEDPAFIDPVNGDFHLSGVSPCINKGFNEAPCILDTDLEGNPRIIGNIVDMGAYEFGY